MGSNFKKAIVSLVRLREKAVKGPPAEASDWRIGTWRNRATSGRTRVRNAGRRGRRSFLVQVDSGEWKQLTATGESEHDPKLSPDGRLVAFRRREDLYCLDIATGKETRLTSDGSPSLLNGELDWVYPEELDLSTAYWWSPDSQAPRLLAVRHQPRACLPQVDLLAPRARLEPERYPKAGDPNADVRVGVISAPAGPRVGWTWARPATS